MIENGNIWQRARRFYGLRNEPEYARPLAEIIWRTLLVISFGAVVGIIVFGVWEFWVVIENLNSAGNSVSKPPPVLNRASLESTLSAIRDREAAFNALDASPKTFADPSK